MRSRSTPGTVSFLGRGVSTYNYDQINLMRALTDEEINDQSWAGNRLVQQNLSGDRNGVDDRKPSVEELVPDMKEWPHAKSYYAKTTWKNTKCNCTLKCNVI